MTHPITTYLNQIRSSLATGAATEHTHRPALAELIEALGDNITAVNEPARIECGAPDLAVLRGDFMVGHVECKDVGTALETAESTEQLKRYRLALDNLILTDYLEFRWYVRGDLRRTVRLARRDARGDLQPESDGRENLAALLTDFLAHEPQSISSARELAERMARLTHLIRDVIAAAFENERASQHLMGWRRAFARVLIPDLDQPENLGQFADMFAQTLSYGLFSARIMHQSGSFNRYTAQEWIPRTNPFLRDFFSFITGAQLSGEPYAGLVEDLIQLLALADLHGILADFGRGAREDDPMMHFYETFLTAYDPQLREQRGVYYTPMPVVSFIVRSVDHLLKTRFNLPRGLADTTKLPDGTHKVLVLDPAVGTATFLYAVIDLIRDDFMQREDAGMWSGYVKEHLLERIFGFEIMMAPYAVAHFKLALQLAGYDLDLNEEQRARWAYDFQADDRIQIYLTNTLEILPEDIQGLYGPMQFVTEEAKAADAVKQEKPIMVVLGNPPYSISSANKSDYIENLMDDYKEAVRDERNIQPLSDDYIKFIRFAHERIERTGSGIVAMITNHSFISGLIHRGMRKSLKETFDEIYVLNLHGNAYMDETTPEGEKDENVFDIRQGVAISILVKHFNQVEDGESECRIFYQDFWGSRSQKYDNLLTSVVSQINWIKIDPISPQYFFVPTDFSLLSEYKTFLSVSNIFPLNSRGIETGKDEYLITFTPSEITKVIKDIASPKLSDEEIDEKYGIRTTSGWPVEKLRVDQIRLGFDKDKIIPVYYRPFDWRFSYFSDFLRRTHSKVTRNLQHDNLALIAIRQVVGRERFTHIGVSNVITETRVFYSNRSAPSIHPLYIYPVENSDMLFDLTSTSHWKPNKSHGGRVLNLNHNIVIDIQEKLTLNFNSQLSTRTHLIENTFGPEDFFAYIYAIFHSPTYRQRYAEFLKIDFPRVPITSDAELFRTLVYKGRELIALHLMEAPILHERRTNYPIPGDNTVAPRGGYPKYTPPEEGHGGRVHINRQQYFEGVPQNIWEFEIGGYQVLHKWLKDRRGRELSYDERDHYQQVVVALAETIRLMAEIDAAIPSWPIE